MTARRLPRSVRRSAAPIGARGVSDPGRRSSILICRILQSSDEIRVPPARRSRRPTGFPVYFRSAFCFHPMYLMVFRASEVPGIRILDVCKPRSSKHYANYALWELRIRNLDTSGPRSSIHSANHAVWELRIQRLNTSGRSFSAFFSKRSSNSTKFKRVDPQDDDFSGAAVTRRKRPQ